MRYAWILLFAVSLVIRAEAQESREAKLQSLNARLDERMRLVKAHKTPADQQQLTDDCFKLYDALYFQWEDEGKRSGSTGDRKNFPRYVRAYWTAHPVAPIDRQCGYW